MPNTAQATAATLRWRKSSRSNDETNHCQCVELADMGALVGVRDSKHTDGPVLAFNRAGLAGLLTSVKAGSFG